MSGNHSSAFIMWKNGVIKNMKGYTPAQAIINLLKLTERLNDYPGAQNTNAQSMIRRQLKILQELKNVVEEDDSGTNNAIGLDEMIAAFELVMSIVHIENITEPLRTIVGDVITHSENIISEKKVVPLTFSEEIIEKLQSPDVMLQLADVDAFVIAPLINVYVNTRQLVGSAGTYYALKTLLSVINTTVSQSETSAQSVAHQKYAFGAFSAFRSIIPEDLYDNPVIPFMMNVQYLLMHQLEDCEILLNVLTTEDASDLPSALDPIVLSFLEMIPCSSPLYRLPDINVSLGILWEKFNCSSPIKVDDYNTHLIIYQNMCQGYFSILVDTRDTFAEEDQLNAVLELLANLLEFVMQIQPGSEFSSEADSQLNSFVQAFSELLLQCHFVPTIFSPVFLSLAGILKILNWNKDLNNVPELIQVLKKFTSNAPALSIFTELNNMSYSDDDPDQPLVPCSVFRTALKAMYQALGENGESYDVYICSVLKGFLNMMENGTTFLTEPLQLPPGDKAILPFTQIAILALLDAFPQSKYQGNDEIISLLQNLGMLISRPEKNPKDSSPLLERNLMVYKSALNMYQRLGPEQNFDVLDLFENLEPLMNPEVMDWSPVETLQYLDRFIELPVSFMSDTLIRLLIIPLISTLSIKNSIMQDNTCEALVSYLIELIQEEPFCFDNTQLQESILTNAAYAYFRARNSLDYTFNPGNFVAYGHGEGPAMHNIEFILSLIVNTIPEDAFSMENPMYYGLIEMLVSAIFTLFDAGIDIPEKISVVVKEEIRTRLLSLLSQPLSIEEQEKAAEIAIKRGGNNMERTLIQAGFSQEYIQGITDQAEKSGKTFQEIMEMKLQEIMQQKYPKRKK